MKIKLILLTLLLSTSMLHAQKLTLSLADAQKYAVEQNKSLQNASIEVKKAHAARWQAIAAMLPQADANVLYTNMCGYEMNFGGMPMTMPPYVTHGVTAQIGLNGQAIMGALLSDLAIEMQDINLEKSEADLRANVMTSYLSILAMEDIVGLLDSSLVNIETLARMTQKAVEVGAQEQTAADQILVRVNTLKNNINANKRNVELAYNSLRILLGVEAGREIELTQTLDELLSAESVLTLLGEDFVLARNHNYQLLQKNTELAKQNKVMAWMAYTPTVGLQYQYSHRKNFSDGGFNMTPPNMVAISVAIPLWSSGKRAAAVTEKKLAYEAAVNTLQETTDQLGIQHQQLRFNLSNAYETYSNEKENIDVTKRVFTSTTNKFEHGVASNLELTNASNDLITAQSTYVQAVLTLVNAQVELAKFLNNK